MTPFEFDAAKSESNRTKHGIDFVVAQGLWNDPMLLEIPAKRTMSRGFWWSDK
jgi:uncharacterized DUF497 family protein